MKNALAYYNNITKLKTENNFFISLAPRQQIFENLYIYKLASLTKDPKIY